MCRPVAIPTYRLSGARCLPAQRVNYIFYLLAPPRQAKDSFGSRGGIASVFLPSRRASGADALVGIPRLGWLPLIGVGESAYATDLNAPRPSTRRAESVITVRLDEQRQAHP